MDILSGYGPGDDLPEGVQPETVLQVTQGGETVAYTLGFTSVAPEGLRLPYYTGLMIGAAITLVSVVVMARYLRLAWQGRIVA